jgi:arylsulfatase A-like enzyme
LDGSLGKILDKLAELDLEQDTLVLWTSDNGSPMTRSPDGPYRGTNAPLFGRGYTTAEGAFRVPTIFWWPGKIPAGTVSDELATTMDLLPTFAHLAGTTAPTTTTSEINCKRCVPALGNFLYQSTTLSGILTSHALIRGRPSRCCLTWRRISAA